MQPTKTIQRTPRTRRNRIKNTINQQHRKTIPKGDQTIMCILPPNSATTTTPKTDTEEYMCKYDYMCSHFNRANRRCTHGGGTACTHWRQHTNREVENCIKKMRTQMQ